MNKTRSARPVNSAPIHPSLPRPTKKSEFVALGIVRDIVKRRLQSGDPLETESEMLARYKVARASLREALRLLEHQGLITVRPGRGVSVAVGMPRADHLARTMTLYLHMSGATYDQLLAARILTEPILASLAAQNPDRALVERMLGPHRAAYTPGQEHLEFEHGYAFHEVIAQLADNPVISLPIAAIAQMEAFHIIGACEIETLHEEDVCDHVAIADAVLKGDPDAAAAAMREHCENVAARFRFSWSHRVGEKIEWR